MITYDIVLDSNQGFQTDSTGKDFLVGDAGNNYISYILQASPGHYKQFPQIGVGIDNYLNGAFSGAQIERDIRVQLEANGFQSPQIDMSKYPVNGTIIINKQELKLS